MTMLALTLGATLISLLALVPLAARDPKRLRTSSQIGDKAFRRPLSGRQRRALGALAIAPGAVLAASGLWAAFLIWIGLATASGWALAQSLAEGSRTSLSSPMAPREQQL